MTNIYNNLMPCCKEIYQTYTYVPNLNINSVILYPFNNWGGWLPDITHDIISGLV